MEVPLPIPNSTNSGVSKGVHIESILGIYTLRHSPFLTCQSILRLIPRWTREKKNVTRCWARKEWTLAPSTVATWSPRHRYFGNSCAWEGWVLSTPTRMETTDFSMSARALMDNLVAHRVLVPGASKTRTWRVTMAGPDSIRVSTTPDNLSNRYSHLEHSCSLADTAYAEWRRCC